MADIYLVSAGQRPIALKRLRECHRHDPQHRKMLIDEANLMAAMSHPCLVSVYDISAVERGYFTMEYVRGRPLSRVLGELSACRALLPVELSAYVMTRVAAALHHAHEMRDERGKPRNVIHRDVSTANVLIGFDGSVKLTDFGVAKARQRGARTRTGHLKGNVGYMSPEQVMVRPLDRRSDIFCMGILLWELLTGRKLFAGPSDYDCMRQIVRHPVTPPSKFNGALSSELEAVVMRALAKEREARYATAHELQLDLVLATMERPVATPDSMALEMRMLFGDSKHRTPSPGYYAALEYGAPVATVPRIGRPKLLARHERPGVDVLTSNDYPNREALRAFFRGPRPRASVSAACAESRMASGRRSGDR